MSRTKHVLEKCLYKILDRKGGVYSFFKVGASLFKHQKPVADNVFKRNCYQGFLNQQVISIDNSEVWPFWVYQQLDPESPFYSPGTETSLLNTTFRNWTTLSVTNSSLVSQIDPKGLITPIPHGWSLDIWTLSETGEILTPSQHGHVTQTLKETAPIVETKWTLDHCTIKSECFISSDINSLLGSISIQNNATASKTIPLILAIRPYNPEGITAIDDISYLSQNTFIVNNQLGIQLDQKPDNILCLSKTDGPLHDFIGKWDMILQSKCPEHMASAYAEYNYELAADASQNITFKMPISPKSKLISLFENSLKPKKRNKLIRTIQDLKKTNYTTQQDRLYSEWENLLNELPKITLPNTSLTKQFQENLIHIKSSIHKKGINSAYAQHNFDITTLFLSICTLNRLNMRYLSRDILRLLIRQVSTSKDITHLSQFILAFDDYITYTQDHTFLSTHFSDIERAMKKIVNSPIKKEVFPNLKTSLRQQKARPSNLTTLTDILWSFSAINSGLSLAVSFKPEYHYPKLKEFEESCTRYLKSELKLLQHSKPILCAQPLNTHLIPILLAWFPLKLINHNTNTLDKLLSHIEDKYMVNNCYCNWHNTTGISPSQNMHLAHIYMTTESPQAYDIICELSNIASATGGWPSAINNLTKGGLYGDGHQLLSSTLYLWLMRRFIITEKELTLNLFPYIPEKWWKDQSVTLSGENLLTRFGPLSATLTLSKQRAHIKLDTKFHLKPKKITIDFKRNIKEVLIDGQKTEIKKNTLLISPSAQEIQITFEECD